LHHDSSVTQIVTYSTDPKAFDKRTITFSGLVLRKTGDAGAVDSRRRKQEMRIKFWVESWRGKGQLEVLCKDGRIILKLIVKNYGKNLWTTLNWLRIRLK
jgi:hypothetical protein